MTFEVEFTTNDGYDIGRRYDVGDKQGYLEAQVEYALRREELADKFREYLKNLMNSELSK